MSTQPESDQGVTTPPTASAPELGQQLDQEHIDAAVEEEQTRLHNFMMRQQTTYLLNRCIELNAQARAEL